MSKLAHEKVTLDTPALPIPDAIDLTPVARAGRNWTAWIGVGISIGILVAVFFQLRDFQFPDIGALIPSSPLFWLLFVLYYMAGPLSELVIFRRLWDIPFSGISPLLRKQVSNELLLGYLGEVYFYAWARRHVKMEGSPFGAVKDVTILSAMVGNVATLVLLALCAPLLVPLFNGLNLPLEDSTIAFSIGFVLVLSLAMLIFRRKLFSLPMRELRFISLVHLLRIVATVGLAAWMWHLALPAVDLSWWLILATWRQLVARLPFIPNKDIAFAAIAVFLVGENVQIAAVMAMMAAFIMLGHLVTGLLLVIDHVLRKDEA